MTPALHPSSISSTLTPNPNTGGGLLAAATPPTTLDPREKARAYLERELAREPSPLTNYDRGWLGEYQAHVLRWIDCAPEGATFLIAPLCGWQGEPFTTRGPVGPDGAPGKALREARERRGLHPFARDAWYGREDDRAIVVLCSRTRQAFAGMTP